MRSPRPSIATAPVAPIAIAVFAWGCLGLQIALDQAKHFFADSAWLAFPWFFTFAGLLFSFVATIFGLVLGCASFAKWNDLSDLHRRLTVLALTANSCYLVGFGLVMR
jgi:hypothetical protein